MFIKKIINVFVLRNVDRRNNNIVTWVLSRRQSDVTIYNPQLQLDVLCLRMCHVRLHINVICNQHKGFNEKDMSRCPWGRVIFIVGTPMNKN